MKRSIVIGGLAGLALFTALIAWYGIAEIADALLAMGWTVLLVAVFRLALLTFDLLSWRVLLARYARPSFARLFWIRWVADSVNTLLPVARVGGEILRAHMLYRRGVDAAAAGASVMVDVTAGIFAQLIFSVVGAIAFVVIVGGGASAAFNLSVGMALFAVGVAVLYVVQRSGLFSRLARFAEGGVDGATWEKLTGAAIEFDSAVAALYRNNRPVALCCAWRIVGWVSGTAEVWLILYFLGHPVSLGEAFILESLGQAARSAGFMVPGGIGIQEGGLVLVGSYLGLTPELALALSLAKRAREILIGLPCLILWQAGEGRDLWRRQRDS